MEYVVEDEIYIDGELFSELSTLVLFVKMEYSKKGGRLTSLFVYLVLLHQLFKPTFLVSETIHLSLFSLPNNQSIFLCFS